MPELQKMALSPADTGSTVVGGANAQAQVTLAAVANYCWLVLGYTLTSDGNVAAAIAPSIVSGAKTIEQFLAPAAAPLNKTVELAKGFVCPVNTSVVATIPPAGSGVKGAITLRARLVAL